MSDFNFHTTRRDFLTGGLSLLSAASTLPIFLGNTATLLAQSAPTTGGKKRDDASPILVIVQLSGGNDGLNTVVPYGMDAYYQYRRRLALQQKDLLKLADGFGLNPAAAGLKDLFDAGRMSIVHGVGYPNPNRSHFVSTDIWHTADPNLRQHSGWLGRYLDAECCGSDPGKRDANAKKEANDAPDPLHGIALMQETPLAMMGERFMPLSFGDPDDLSWRNPKGDAAARETWEKLNNIDGKFSGLGSPVAQFLQRAALQAQVGADQIKEAAGGAVAGPSGRRRRGRPNGPDALNNQLQMVARMIAADLPTRVYYVSLGGFDTHSQQMDRHARLLTQFGNSMRDFINTLNEDGLLDRVLVLAFSEFGRRVQENASGGTDHGEAAPLFLFGSALRPGLHGQHPDLRKLNRGDLAHTVDFRQVYAAVLRDWLKIKPEEVLGPGFGPLRLMKKSQA